MIVTENFWWSEENYCDSRHLRGNIDGFLQDGKSGNINRNTNWSRCDICVQNVESAGSAGPRGPATWTDTEGFFFLERASPTPTWIRPLTVTRATATTGPALGEPRRSARRLPGPARLPAVQSPAAPEMHCRPPAARPDSTLLRACAPGPGRRCCGSARRLQHDSAAAAVAALPSESGGAPSP
jgi:hypothetical protein